MMKDMMFQQAPMKENMSNLTYASGEASISSSGNRYFDPQAQPPPPKKKRNLPGNPDPSAVVIALSPKALMATNRFICEICNKGFQRDQNLQLHRRGHNLPWKLKHKSNKEVRKKVYVCPEANCVHNDPARALGDLTGIKKHFCRKHGEKKWKCNKCSKRYAVQSDWKAHSKICGTKEYKCDCGTLFSRRDSFITHRAFCDALAEESSRSKATISTNPLLSTQPQHLNPFSLKKEQENNLMQQQQPLLVFPTPQPIFSIQNPNPNTSIGLPPNHSTATTASATALLQKAAHMGSKMTTTDSSQSTAAGMLVVNSNSGPHNQTHVTNRDSLSCLGNKAASFQGMMMTTSVSSAAAVSAGFNDGGCFEDAFGFGWNGHGGAGEGLTRDFLGLRSLSHSEIISLSGFASCINASQEFQNPSSN